MLEARVQSAGEVKGQKAKAKSQNGGGAGLVLMVPVGADLGRVENMLAKLEALLRGVGIQPWRRETAQLWLGALGNANLVVVAKTGHSPSERLRRTRRGTVPVFAGTMDEGRKDERTARGGH